MVVSCKVYRKPLLGDDSGTGSDREDCKANFRIAWVRIRGAISDADIAKTREMLAAVSDRRFHDEAVEFPARMLISTISRRRFFSAAACIRKFGSFTVNCFQTDLVTNTLRLQGRFDSRGCAPLAPKAIGH
jgi:hypothetical protein